jgi:hypothetical protein
VGRPHPALLALAAGGDPGPISDRAILSSAIDHGMQGLLWTFVRDRAPDCPWRTELAGADLAVRRRHQRLRDTLVGVRDRLASRGVDMATAKGVTAEARWYEREGERPCSDVDILVAPDSLADADAVLDALDPTHPLRGAITGLVARDRLQSVNATLDGVAVDVHFDLFKLGVPTRQRDVVWERAEPFALPDGSKVRVPDAEMSLIHLLVHLNKDSFAWLLGFVDVAHILRDETIDWAFVDRFVRAEGLEVAAYRSLATVTQQLGLPPAPLAAAGGARSWAWGATWPARATLLGSAGAHRSRRQEVLPFLVRGRTLDAARSAAHVLLPPAATVAAQYGDIRGPYLRRLALGRLRTVRARREALRARVDRALEPAPANRDPDLTARLLREKLTEQALWLDVYGGSMGQSIRGGTRVRVSASAAPRRGEVWAFCNDRGEIVVHRARGAAPGGFRFQGDTCVRADAPVPADRLIGRAIAIDPHRRAWRWGPAAGAVQRVPRLAVAWLARRLERRR